MDDALLSGLVDYTNGLRDNLSRLAIVRFDHRLALLYKGLDL